MKKISYAKFPTVCIKVNDHHFYCDMNTLGDHSKWFENLFNTFLENEATSKILEMEESCSPETVNMVLDFLYYEDWSPEPTIKFPDFLYLCEKWQIDVDFMRKFYAYYDMEEFLTDYTSFNLLCCFDKRDCDLTTFCRQIELIQALVEIPTLAPKITSVPFFVFRMIVAVFRSQRNMDTYEFIHPLLQLMNKCCSHEDLLLFMLILFNKYELEMSATQFQNIRKRYFTKK